MRMGHCHPRKAMIAGRSLRSKGPCPPLQSAPENGSGRIAQLVEQLTLNQRVLGSSPSASTIFQHDLKGLLNAADEISRDLNLIKTYKVCNSGKLAYPAGSLASLCSAIHLIRFAIIDGESGYGHIRDGSSPIILTRQFDPHGETGVKAPDAAELLLRAILPLATGRQSFGSDIPKSRYPSLSNRAINARVETPPRQRNWRSPCPACRSRSRGLPATSIPLTSRYPPLRRRRRYSPLNR